ncbi:unnamed protein product [Hydatigera taeniaeformis]|uniref:Ras-associating domain-containing protein n=1 Tax=Hydatigena taeniaeformis TaxID=6205 RepID=A0A0R3WSL0_HYDTA|nr:unnamed protein product [Hydatigera taeniaeformis]
MNEKGEKQEVETSEVSAIWDATPDDKATVDGTVHVATDGVGGRCASKKERVIMISAFLTGIEQESYVLRTESPSFLQSGTPTQVSAIHESQTCAPLSAENTSKEEEGKDGNEEVILTRDEIMEKTSDLVDTEITCAYSTCQVTPALSHSSASTRPLTLSVVLELPKDEEEEEENVADEVRMGSLENLASTSFELTTIGAFKLSDGSPIQIMLSGGSVIKHNQTLLEMQRYLLHEKASTFSASDTIKKYLENTGISKFTVQTLSNHEEEERRGSGETVQRSDSQVRAASAMSPIESEVSTRRESRKTCTFRVSEGAPLMLKQLRQSQCKRRKIMWEKHRRYVREEAGSFLEGCRCRPIVLVDDEADCSAIVHMIGKTTESTVGYFSLRQDAPPPVTTICHSCFKRRQIVWSKYRRQLSEEAETFLTEKLTHRDDKQSMSLVSLPHLLPSLNAPASVESIDIGPARILITSNRREDGGVVAHIVTEFPLNPVPSDNSKNLQFVFDVAMPEEPI